MSNGDTDMDGVDDVSFLAGSEPRASIVAALAAEGALSRDELVDRCGAARVTVGRNLDRLTERGLAVEDAGTYRLTALGDALAADFLDLLDTAAATADLAPLLEHLPPDALDLDPLALADAEVVVSTAANPYAPAERHAASLETAGRVRQVLPAVSGQSMEASADRILAGDLEMEVVVTPAVAETLLTDLADKFAPLRDCEHHTTHVYDGEVPYFLGLVDDAVQIGVSDDEGIPRALAVTTSDRVGEWAESTWEDHVAAAEPLEATDPS